MDGPEFDRRIDRLAERHEALTQSVEMMRTDWEDQRKSLIDHQLQLGQSLTALIQSQAQMEGSMALLANVIHRP